MPSPFLGIRGTLRTGHKEVSVVEPSLQLGMPDILGL